ncbi:uncharacterized protein [Oryza sativa Japonica Group]|uniref:Os08g0483100 protein n=5 Tax=Oryza TaxID=4527 RepID=Q0J4X9_ORYSJ|nr:uncharacterized protein LOC4345862 [Oryza sativa Japonica Group]KAB8108919.1 hypothetical protein EE612_044963 [Oryza sativa]KAF2920164.1 hypothetical protein DAI22_08g190100 [Oryza sativa Japonica Group]BAD09297.1 unknown protein [Oryza sativa Japonica Group]BAF23986.1 Os08g0483100 [Oryza sativa Japonica Group]BAG94308.1 unnamed protein product [Oryza sativa Japonica Group]|eukprot:NP_001062072.1 Os08g0483100 [Oryza sativa Japonica Group]
MPRRTASSAAAAPGRGGMEWELEREMVLMAAAGGEHQKKQRQQQPARRAFATDLLQNCDLPPPAKLFGPLPTLQRLENAAAWTSTSPDRKGGDGEGGGGDGGDRLMRALRLSQSRAREAEEKLAAAGASNGELSALLVRDSVVLSAHRRWVMMLEAENSGLRGAAGAAGSAKEGVGEDEDEDDDGGARRGAAAWWLALAVCVGIAGIGLAMGKLL